MLPITKIPRKKTQRERKRIH